MSQPDVSSSSTAQDLSSVNALRAVYADKQVGECFEFGRYPQGANGEIEPITWRVLRRNTDHLLVIAERGLDRRPYNKSGRKVVWENCTLRRWLNSAFYDTAFNEQERKCIMQKTGDNIFLLSVDEARSLFANEDERRAEPTKYAVKNGVWTSDFDNGCCLWWLRSRGDSAKHAACVDTDGDIDCRRIPVFRVYHDSIAVRPVFKIALDPPAQSQSAASPLCAIYADKRVGECFEFGRYPQGANGQIVKWSPCLDHALKKHREHFYQ